MDRFEKQFENLDVVSAAMGGAIDSATAGAVPQGEVANYMANLMAQANLANADAVHGMHVGAGAGPVGAGAAAAGDRLAAPVGAPPPGDGSAPPPAGGPGAGGGAGAGGAHAGGAASLEERLAALRKK